MFNRLEVAKGRNSRLSRALFANFVTKLYILRNKTQHIQAILFWKYPFLLLCFIPGVKLKPNMHCLRLILVL